MKNKTSLQSKRFFWQFATILGLIILLANPLPSSIQMLGTKHGIKIPLIATAVQAKEIYPMFTCPCCGKPLNKEKPCCGNMAQMIDFIDQKIKTGASKKVVIMATVQEFGLERLANKKDQVAFRKQLLANAPKNSPRIGISKIKKDLGKVNRKNGVVTTEFSIENIGKSDLIIDKLSSSCGCTSGAVIYQGVEGPRFYMPGHGHKKPNPNWKVAIAPGKEAKIKVYYDPMVHPDLTGAVTRTISIHSNDPVDFETKLTIILEQI